MHVEDIPVAVHNVSFLENPHTILTIYEIVTVIKACYATTSPREGCDSAITTINSILVSDDHVVVERTLFLLDTLYRQCGKPFSICFADYLSFYRALIESPDLSERNRQQFLNMIGDWVSSDFDNTLSKHLDMTPKLRQFFEALLRAGYDFPEESLSKLPPGTVERLRNESNQWWKGVLNGFHFKSVKGVKSVSPPPSLNRTTRPVVAVN
ncbi:hypothetical protein HDU79_007541 [Rhizoclosmatium sp. JEL0117]|nr:hypothetical protein HDU79_007541 [Rhizoclosmatium sp. JEL0117]